MLDGVLIRSATRADREAIKRLVTVGVRDIRKRIGPHPPPVCVEDLGVRGCVWLVAAAGTRVIGSVSYRVRGRRLHLFNLVVDAKYRQMGVARMFVRRLEEIAVGSGASHMTVQTFAELGVEECFKKLGFRTKSSRREFLFAMERERALTTLYMVKLLRKNPLVGTGA